MMQATADIRSIASIINGERNAIANMANIASVLYHGLEDLNWVGFYLLHGTELVLGPFQGRVACIRIEMGRGVCGKAAMEQQTIIVPNVHEFADHIACDAASNSEIVVPLVLRGRESGTPRLLGVLDVDSPKFDRFSNEDAALLESVAQLLVDGSDWP
jgi:GAF domain-containing protein